MERKDSGRRIISKSQVETSDGKEYKWKRHQRATTKRQDYGKYRTKNGNTGQEKKPEETPKTEWIDNEKGIEGTRPKEHSEETRWREKTSWPDAIKLMQEMVESARGESSR